MSVRTWLDDSKLRTRMPNCAPGTAGFAPVIVFWIRRAATQASETWSYVGVAGSVPMSIAYVEPVSVPSVSCAWPPTDVTSFVASSWNVSPLTSIV